MASVADEKERSGSAGNMVEQNVTKAIKQKQQADEQCDKSEPNNSWWLLFGVILLMTVGTRFYNVTVPDHVCWDETHFGKMGSWYINRTFFFDVHPPLGKMLIGLSGYLTGYDGTYPFDKPGDKYNGTHYEGMRIFCTALGAAIVPMSFHTVWDMTGSLTASTFAAAYILFDIGMLILNRYILLDPPLIFFMTASVMGMARVSRLTREANSFSTPWWSWLAFTGSMLACTISVKFVGLFVVLLVGLHTASDLWDVLGDLTLPITHTVRQLIARALTLIVLPIVLYAGFFYIHLTVLNRSGSGDGFYSSGFQSNLIGNSLYNVSMPRQVAYGAVVTLKNHKTGGGYLHSHNHLYPKGFGARQQQVTTYSHKDDNNKWLIKPYDKQSLENVTLIKHGDLVRLEHVQTRRNLHSHREQGPVTKKHLQVTCYGEDGQGDTNDVWLVQIVGGKTGQTVETVTSRLTFYHYIERCVLTTTSKQLPKWGFEQQEVTCNPNIRDKAAQWNVEDNQFEQLPSVNFQVYAPGFISRFFESHAVMLQGNAGLKPKEGEVTSRPWQWPINYRGQFFSGSDHRVYLLGNPIIWWSNLVFLALFLIIFGVEIIRYQRYSAPGHPVTTRRTTPDPSPFTEDATKWQLLRASLWLFGGWLIHYLPFYAMGRVLYFHHYFPALVFNSMLAGVMLDYITGRLPGWLRHACLGTAMAGLVYSFVLFSPLAYGMSGPFSHEPNSTLASLKWMSSWEF
ncbi:protein O-mannosyl-transferase 2 [Anopheles marshallii]|uniref:protein O-mannosyl-transferase 2 n=1 Tax=Anopheles marshallii TaxID=1521116 RepID=UPI00237C1DEE|nr:protein O-mannosyl-transferase 2 [Anopheles marshallii]